MLNYTHNCQLQAVPEWSQGVVSQHRWTILIPRLLPTCSMFIPPASGPVLLWAHRVHTQRMELIKSIILWQGRFSASFIPQTGLCWLPTPSASTGGCRNTQPVWEKKGNQTTPSNSSPKTSQLSSVINVKAHSRSSDYPTTAFPDPREIQAEATSLLLGWANSGAHRESNRKP